MSIHVITKSGSYNVSGDHEAMLNEEYTNEVGQKLTTIDVSKNSAFVLHFDDGRILSFPRLTDVEGLEEEAANLLENLGIGEDE